MLLFTPSGMSPADNTWRKSWIWASIQTVVFPSLHLVPHSFPGIINCWLSDVNINLLYLWNRFYFGFVFVKLDHSWVGGVKQIQLTSKLPCKAYHFIQRHWTIHIDWPLQNAGHDWYGKGSMNSLTNFKQGASFKHGLSQKWREGCFLHGSLWVDVLEMHGFHKTVTFCKNKMMNTSCSTCFFRLRSCKHDEFMSVFHYPPLFVLYIQNIPPESI